MNVKSYMLVVDNDAQHFSQKVNNHIKEGWEVFGSPFVNKNGYYCQAVVLPWGFTEDSEG
jgi:hypothetical protein